MGGFPALLLVTGVLCLSHCTTLVTAGGKRGPKDPNNLKFYIYDFPGESLGWIGDNNWLKTSIYYHGYGKDSIRIVFAREQGNTSQLRRRRF